MSFVNAFDIREVIYMTKMKVSRKIKAVFQIAIYLCFNNSLQIALEYIMKN